MLLLKMNVYTLNLLLILGLSLVHISSGTSGSTGNHPLKRNIRSTFKSLVETLVTEKEAKVISNCKLNGYPDIGPTLQTAYDDMKKCQKKKRIFLTEKNDYLSNFEECSKNYIKKVKGCLRDDQKYFPQYILEVKKAYGSMMYNHIGTIGHDVLRCMPKLNSIEAQKGFFQCITDVNIKYNSTSEIPSSKALQCRSHIPKVHCVTNMLRDNCDKTAGMDQFTEDYNNVIERFCET